MSLEDIHAEHLRGAVLGLLTDGIWRNDAILHDGVNSVKLVSADRDQVRDAMRWLAEYRLASLDEIPAGAGQRSVLRLQIADRGRDFEAGRVFVEGIRRRSQD